ncbi:MAG: transglycosylase SLT domain-containing protein [Myxococcota bacterium]
MPGPAPFSETAPLLPEMWRLAIARDAGPRAVAAGLQVLDDWLAHAGQDDPLARATGEFLRARLLTKRGDTAAARAAWEALAMQPGAFSDEARQALAELEARSPPVRNPRPGGAAHWLLTRSPGAPDYLAGVKKAVKDLTRRHQGERAAELLADALGQGMADDTRKELLLLRAELVPAAEAKATLLDAWWLDDSLKPDARITSRLKKLRAAPDADALVFREALNAPRAGNDKARRALARKARPVAELALALGDRWDDDTATAALKQVDRVEKTLAATPYPAYTRAVLLRKIDRDAEAVSAFAEVIARFPDHPLADLARAQSSVLLRALGRAREADQLDEALLAGGALGALQRDALWRLGFGAILRGDGATAEARLRELEQRYGGEPDRHSFCWFERARYWRGRAALLMGDRGQAEEHFKAVVARFPAGWYALLARDRAKLGPRPKRAELEAMWDVSRADPMATALALYRLGAESEARETFEALMDAQQLPGNGRKLLADLWDLDGKSQKADRVLRYAAIPATMPGDDPDDLYLAWFPFVHGDDVSAAAHENHLPSQLLAGIVSVETRFQAKGRSRVGAIGLAQLMPTTGQAIGRKLFGDSFKAAQLWDPATNLAVAAKYLSSLLDRFSGNPALAVAAYNAGPAPVKKWLAERGRLELDAFVETIPYEQARRYVMRVLSDAEIYRRLYGLESEPIPLPRTLSE